MKTARRVFWTILLGGIAVLVAVANLIPDTTQVSSNLDDLEWRPLTTTTTRPAPKATTTTRPNGELVVIDGSHVIRVPRTPAAAQLLALIERMQP